MIEEFRYEYAQIQSKFAILSITTEWATFKAIFCSNKIKKIYVIWYHKSWANIIITKDLDNIRRQIIKQLYLKINRNFLQCFVIEIQEQQSE